jgi:hypothetical protein
MRTIASLLIDDGTPSLNDPGRVIDGNHSGSLNGICACSYDFAAGHDSGCSQHDADGRAHLWRGLA